MKKKPNIRHDLPVSVNAPVVLDARTDYGVQPLFDYIGAMESNTSETVAAAEAKRLGPYFDALSAYFSRALDALDKDAEPNRKKLEKLSTPESLEGLFNAAAKRTHNVLTSSVALLPSDILEQGPASYLFRKAKQFSVPYDYNGHTFNFGFLQVYEAGQKWLGDSSMAIPTFLLDAEMLRAVAAYQPSAMLKQFQNVITWVNHDMLHHYTSPIIIPKVAKKFDFGDVVKFEGMNGPVHTWAKGLSYGYRSLYEQWALMSHEKVLLTPGNERQVEEVEKNVTAFFDDLKRIRDELARSQGPEKAHDVVDYFGTVMAHALTRVFPLHHPMMAHCLDCMEKTDPMPEKCVAEARNMVPPLKQPSALRVFFAKLVRRKLPEPEPLPPEPLDALRVFATRRGYVKRMSAAYKESGLDIFPAENADVGYRHIKLLELIAFSPADIYPHIPKAASPSMAELQAKTDRTMIGMITAASQSFHYKPK